MSDLTKAAKERAKGYRSYLLRLWCAATLDGCWRASLEDLRTGERLGFAGLEPLFAYLMEQVESDGKGGKME
jgi:hypothetical protein